MAQDRYGRTVTVSTANGVDTYQVTDTNVVPTATFSLGFPHGTPLSRVQSVLADHVPPYAAAARQAVIDADDDAETEALARKIFAKLRQIGLI